MVDYVWALIVAYWIQALVIGTVWSTGFSFTYGYIRGKKFFNTYYWGENRFAMFWASFFWLLFWFFYGGGKILCALHDPFWILTNFLIKYSPFMLAYEAGLYLARGKEEIKEDKN